MASTADVTIIGSGIVGASTALELSRSGLDVKVVDKAAGPGLGSTSASSAVVRFIYSTWDGVAAAWESKFRWEEWETHLGFRDPAGMARFVRTGAVFVDVDVAPRARICGLLSQAGIPYEEWDADELSARVPGADAGRYYPPKPVTSDAFYEDAAGRVGAVFTPDGGYVDDPQLAAANLARAAERAGAAFHFRRTVTAIARVGTDWRVTLGTDGSIVAPIVVNCSGPWSSAVNLLAGVGSDFRVEVSPMRQEVHHVPLPPRLTERNGPLPVIADLDLGMYLRSDSDHSLLVGGTEPESDPLEWIDDPDAVDLRPTMDRYEAQTFRAARRLPDLPVPQRPRGIVGVYDVSSDWTPVYDRTQEPGFYVAMGTSGNQFKNAPLIGDLMETVITGVQAGHDHDVVPLSFTAPHTGHVIDLGAFSRRRLPHPDSTGTVLG